MLAFATATLAPSASIGGDSQSVDYLSFAQGAFPVELGGMAAELKVGIDKALAAIDGDSGGFGLPPKPGGPDTEIVIVYKLPVQTIFTEFAVPN